MTHLDAGWDRRTAACVHVHDAVQQTTEYVHTAHYNNWSSSYLVHPKRRNTSGISVRMNIRYVRTELRQNNCNRGTADTAHTYAEKKTVYVLPLLLTENQEKTVESYIPGRQRRHIQMHPSTRGPWPISTLKGVDQRGPASSWLVHWRSVMLKSVSYRWTRTDHTNKKVCWA